MEKIVEFVKSNLPLIAAIIAVVAAIVVIIVVVCSVSKKKRANEVEETSSQNQETASLNQEPSAPEQEAAVSEIEEPVKESVAVEEKRVKIKEVAAAKASVVKEDKKPVKTEKALKQESEPVEKTVKPIEEKPESEKVEEKVESVDEKQVGVKKVVGKWIVKEKGEGEFVDFLYANNGELILTSEIYSSEESAKKGVETIRKNLQTGTISFYKDKNGNYYFKVKSIKNRILCVGETYKTRELSEHAAESVKRFADSPVQEEIEKDITVIKYEMPSDEPEVEVKSGYTGKWIIEEDDGAFVAKLLASNGELLLNSESYVSYASAKSAITTITNNGINGNFIIDSDKKGRYFFKLRSVQKATLCVGETYAQLSACQSAIESVRRFLKTAKLTEEK